MGTAGGPDKPAMPRTAQRALQVAIPEAIIYPVSIHPSSRFMALPLQDEVLQLLLAAPSGLPAPAIRRQLRHSISQPTLWRALEHLRAQGRVIADGRARATRYYAAEYTDLSTLRSRRLHESAARRLAADPSLRELARQRLLKLRQVNPHGRIYHDRWQELLDGSLPLLLRTMTEISERSDTLRQESPFGVLVTADERRRVFESTRAA